MWFQSTSQICDEVDWPGNSLKISLCALHFDLQAEGIFTWAVIFRLTAQMALSLAYTVPACNWCTFGFLDLKGACFLLVTKGGKVSKLVASFTLVLFSRALKAFYMSWITTLWVSIFVSVGTLGIKSLLMLALHLGTFTSMLLVIWLSGFCKWFLFLVFSCW